MRIGELVRVTGVSRETIHFYLREGLLPPAHKVNARLAYFDDEHVARLRVILKLREAHLPLSMIRDHLQAAQGMPAQQITELFLPFLAETLGLDGAEPELSADAVIAHSHLTQEQLMQLEAAGVLRPAMHEGRPLYTQADADAALAARTLLDQGVALSALRFVRRYAGMIEQEHGFIVHHLINPAIAAGRREQVSARRGFQALLAIESYLRRQFRRSHGVFGDAAFNVPDPLYNAE